DSERRLLQEIDEALGRITEGSYGICMGTGKPIRLARLEAQPWACYCVEYARMLEEGLVVPEQ
ncbi:TraR/DksA family transcriptional regulator, partial [Planctomycetota bacterium]